MTFTWYTIPAIITVLTILFWGIEKFNSLRETRRAYSHPLDVLTSALGGFCDAFLWFGLIIINLIAWLIGALCK